MKRLFIIVIALLVAFSSFSQEKKSEPISRKDQIQSAKIAFFTTAIGLTPEDAQIFWPVYNQCWEARQKAHFTTVRSFSNLRRIQKEGNKSETEIKDAVQKYLDNMNAEMKVYEQCCQEYEKVLSPDKLLKFYLAEEDFRAQIIKMWKEPKKQEHPQK